MSEKEKSELKQSVIDAFQQARRHLTNPDSEVIRRLRFRLALGRFVLLIDGGIGSPMGAHFVSSEHLRSQASWVPCIRVDVHRDGELCSGLAFEKRVVQRVDIGKAEIVVTTSKRWAERMWKRAWGDWKPGKILDMPEFAHSKTLNYGNVFYVGDYRASFVTRNWESQYLAIMLLWDFWNKFTQKKMARAADLKVLGLIREGYSDGSFANLCKRCGCKLVIR